MRDYNNRKTRCVESSGSRGKSPRNIKATSEETWLQSRLGIVAAHRLLVSHIMFSRSVHTPCSHIVSGAKHILFFSCTVWYLTDNALTSNWYFGNIMLEISNTSTEILSHTWSHHACILCIMHVSSPSCVSWGCILLHILLRQPPVDVWSIYTW